MFKFFIIYFTNPNDEDTDDDGFTDAEDVFPEDPDEWVDSDNDTFGDNGDAFSDDPNEWEDSDDDGLSDEAEINTHGTDPNNADTDGDGLLDGAKGLRSGTFAELVRHMMLLPADERKDYYIEKAGDREYHVDEIVSLSKRDDFPRS